MLRIDKELFRGLGSMARGDSNRYPVEVTQACYEAVPLDL